jgi:hypothetical protein
VVRFDIQVFSYFTAGARLGSCGVLVLASACSVYSADLLNGSGALSNAGGSAMTTGGADSAGNAGTTPASAANGGMSQAGGSTDGGDAGEGQLSSAGSGAVGTVAGGGKGGTSGGGTGGGSAGVANNAGAATVDTNLIDDFEDNDKQIVIVSNPRRDGIWDTNNDMTVGGVQTPTPLMFKPTLLGADAPYAGDMYAAHSTGSGFTNYGAYMNVSMRAVADYATTPVYDASSYKGISFRAKASAASGKIMRVRFVSGDTDPRLKKCVAPGTPETACYNHYYATVTLTTSWAVHSVAFSSFVQGTDGMINPGGIDLKEMYGLEFYFPTPSDYDLWLDDLTFTK